MSLCRVTVRIHTCVPSLTAFPSAGCQRDHPIMKPIPHTTIYLTTISIMGTRLGNCAGFISAVYSVHYLGYMEGQVVRSPGLRVEGDSSAYSRTSSHVQLPHFSCRRIHVRVRPYIRLHPFAHFIRLFDDKLCVTVTSFCCLFTTHVLFALHSTDMAHSFRALLLLLCASFPYSIQQIGPLQLRQSKKVYGPDGPWHAVSVGLGSPVQTLDLYPGGNFGSHILTNFICMNSNVELCGSGGLYNAANSITSGANTGIEIEYDQQSGNTIGSSFTNGALLLELGNSSYTQDTLSISYQSVDDFDIYTYSFFHMIYPDGTHYPVQVGMLSLGADGADYNQTFTENAGIPSINSTLIPNNLYQNGFIPSSSYGLHYGSAASNLDLSLWLGGYDASRIIGQVSSQSYATGGDNVFVLDLLDIGIAVDHGASPFNYTSKSGFLASGNTTISDGATKSIPVLINFAAPYLNLPNSTCNAIAQELPVTYSSKYGLYLWNVDNPQYTRIITSPTYLNFTFYLSGGATTFAINVPFQLLNLTLDAPLSSRPLQYFPCQPPQDPNNQQYGLGRAFLQAAFIGVNWGDGQKQFFLAQAPGPHISSVADYRPLENGEPPVGNGGSWVASWNSSWTPLAAPNSHVSSVATPTPAPDKSGIAGGAIAGIAVGTVVVVLIGIALCVFAWRRKRTSNSQSHPALIKEEEKKEEGQAPGMEGPPQYLTAELHNSQVLSELGSNEAGRYELSTLSSPTQHSPDTYGAVDDIVQTCRWLVH